MNEKCSNCGVHIGMHNWQRPPVRYRVAGPWDPLYEEWSGHCPKCGEDLISLIRDWDTHPVNWVQYAERLVPGKTCEIVKRSRCLPMNNVDTYWAWHPLTSDKVVTNKMMKIIIGMIQQSLRPARVVTTKHMSWFDVKAISKVAFEIIALEDAVMQDQCGPYPSLRAERTLRKTFHDTCRFMHCWPSASFRPEYYLPLGANEELPMMWARYRRHNIKVQINQEM
jgi:hypothetical protein